MFSFNEQNYKTIETNVKYDDMVEKYPDSYMIAMNGHLINEEIHGDIVAILSATDYHSLNKPKNIVPRFSIWKGIAVRTEEVHNRLGISL